MGFFRLRVKKMGKISKGLAASIGYFVGSLIAKGIGYFTTPLYTRLLTAEEYGKTAVFLSWAQALGIVFTFSLQNGVFNNGMVDYPDKRNEYSFSMLVLSNLITLLCSAVLLLSYPLIHPILKMDFEFTVLMCLLFAVQPAYNLWMTRQRYEYRYKSTVFWSVICVIASSGMALCLLKFSGLDRLHARIFGAELTLVVIYIGFYIYVGKRAAWKLRTTYWKGAFLFNLPLIPHYLSIYCLNSSDRIMISHLVSDTAAAHYSVAYSVASVATIIWTAINSSLIPFTYEKCKKEDYKPIASLVNLLLFIFAAGCFGVILLAPEVVAFMAPKSYQEAIYVIPPIVGGVFFQVQYSVYANVVYYYKKPFYVMLASVSSAVLNIILNFIFIPKFGYAAAGYTTLICYLLQALLDCAAMKAAIGFNFYNMKFIALLSGVVLCVIPISNFLYHGKTMRYALIVIALALFAAFQKKMRNKIHALLTGK